MESESSPKIYSAIIAVMADVGAVGKTSRNQQQGFMYRSIDAVMNALHPAMAAHKIFCAPEILEQTREERTSSKGATLIYSICKIKYTFYAEDGSNVSVVVIGEGMDSGDKATNKAMAIAFKYACFQLFCIPTEEMIDPDSESPEVAGKGKKGNSAKREQEGKPISGEMAGKINSLISELGLEMKTILTVYKVSAVEQMTAEQAVNCLKRLEATKKNREQSASSANQKYGE